MSFPVRVKILITLLMVVTVVVSLITFTMAGLFLKDKKAYITDLVSLTAEGTARGCKSILASYEDRLRIYAQVMGDEDLSIWRKEEFLKSFFTDFDQLIAVTLYRNGTKVSDLHNRAGLEVAGLTIDDLLAERSGDPLALDEVTAGKIVVENSTLNAKLSMFTLTVPYSPAARNGGAPQFVVSAVIRLDELIRATRRPGFHDVYMVDSNGVLLVSGNPALIAERRKVEAEPLVLKYEHVGTVTKELDRSAVLGAAPADGSDEAVICGLADVEFGGVTVIAEIPTSVINLEQKALLQQLVRVAAFLLVGAALVSTFGSRRITRPVERLAAAAREIGRGRFEVHVDVRSRDEIGSLARSFNQMASELRERERALEEAHRQLLQSEKMAAFGQLGAGIAHEVKNPLAGILGCAQLSLRKTDPGSPLQRNLQLIEKETKRCKAIVENLLRFARQEKAVQEPLDINAVIHDAVAIVSHQLEINQVKLALDLADDVPKIRGNSNQLQQVLMNLLINAQQAMEGMRGSVAITTRRLGSAAGRNAGRVEIRVADTGPGIPRAIQGKIFEPFFTTKPNGKGTGLGLSVSFGIVKDHHGEILVQSESGRGATFVILLPPCAVEHRGPSGRSAPIDQAGSGSGERLAGAA